MRILFLSTALPYPPDSGAKIRDFNLLKEISKKHDVVLISFVQDEKEKKYIESLKPYCREIEVIKQAGKMGLFRSILMSFFTTKPLTIAKFYSSRMEKKIKDVLSKDKFDLIHCSHLHMAQYVENIKDIPVILDEHNIEFFLIKRYVKEQRNLIKKMLVFFLQCLKLKKYEAAMVKKFKQCLVVSEIDKNSLESISPGVNARVISNGVDIDSYKPQPGKIQPHSLVFTGVMDWYPNEDGILYFCDTMLPLIKKEFADVRLFVVGRNPSAKILSLGKRDKNIVVTGYVDDVKDYIARGAVYIVPLRIGGGSRLKILEAMAMGKAIISTSVGCEGLEVLDEKNILIADTPARFSQKVAALLKNDAFRNELGNNARKLVEDRYSWNIIGNKLEQVYEQSSRQKN